jgi:hypothetical protein
MRSHIPQRRLSAVAVAAVLCGFATPAFANAYMPFVPTTVMMQAIFLVLVILVEWPIVMFILGMQHEKKLALKSVAMANLVSTAAGFGVLLLWFGIETLDRNGMWILGDIILIPVLFAITCVTEYKWLKKKLPAAFHKGLKPAVIAANVVTYAMLFGYTCITNYSSSAYVHDVIETASLRQRGKLIHEAELGNPQAAFELAMGYLATNTRVPADVPAAAKWCLVAEKSNKGLSCEQQLRNMMEQQAGACKATKSSCDMTAEEKQIKDLLAEEAKLKAAEKPKARKKK